MDQMVELWGHLDSNFDKSWSEKRLQFYFYELQASSEHAFEKLLKVFFEDWRFRIVHAAPRSQEVLESLRLSEVLRLRRGHPAVLAGVLGYFGQKLGLDFRVAEGSRLDVMKYVGPNDNSYFSLEREGEILSTQQVLSALQGVGPKEFLEELTCEKLFMHYLEELKREFVLREDWSKAVVALSWLIEFQPSNLKAVAERAMIFFKLDRHRPCLLDLKRYFSFIDYQNADPKLVQIFKDLTRKNV